ncbi:hypothetical protein HL667_33710 [Bradyrhizobium sp. 83012]|uniref:Terminase small subunit n=1 Tax=Bradyrhizobium aeschynomenes TaxID=2734909 RepID=A0ABX2CP58_9BRAD|nr:hypothetical protein [Bradyrhizobium aeschynomenes]NPU69989.1 hypothetical protein [Bradyrhizobium aeschynomenes]
MKPPGKSTLARMQQTAFNEAERIEISQDARVLAGLLKAPMPDQVALRDDFAAIVRLIDAIESDQGLKDQLQRRIDAMNQVRLLAVRHAEALAAAAAAREADAVEYDAE